MPWIAGRWSRRRARRGLSLSLALRWPHADEAAASADVTWDAEYDVIVVGYGLAGGTAARHAADAGARVLLIDAAPEGQEGGNTRYAKQLLASGHDVESAVSYLKALNADFEVDEDMVQLFAEKMVDLPNYCREYLGAEVYPLAWQRRPRARPVCPGVSRASGVG